jgi:hypothetical protein
MRSGRGEAMKKMLLFSSIVALLGVGSFFFFKSFYELDFTDFSTEVIVALLGSVITVAITAVLLQSQVVYEVSREKSVGVFQEKLNLYKEFVEFLNSIVEDDSIATKELFQMRGWALKLSLVAGWGIIAEINHFIAQTMKFKNHRYCALTSDEKTEWRMWFAQTSGREPRPDLTDGENLDFATYGRIVAELKKDLGEESLTKDAELNVIWRTIDSLLNAGRLI